MTRRAARQGTPATWQGSLDPHASHSTLGHSTSALLGAKLDLSSNGHSTLGHSTHARLSKDHSIHLLPGQDHSTSALPVHLSLLPQASEAAGVAEYIVFAEAVAQDGIDPAGQDDKEIPVALATEALLSQSRQGPLQLQWPCPISVMTLHDHRHGKGDSSTFLDQSSYILFPGLTPDLCITCESSNVLLFTLIVLFLSKLS